MAGGRVEREDLCMGEEGPKFRERGRECGVWLWWRAGGGEERPKGGYLQPTNQKRAFHLSPAQPRQNRQTNRVAARFPALHPRPLHL